MLKKRSLYVTKFPDSRQLQEMLRSKQNKSSILLLLLFTRPHKYCTLQLNCGVIIWATPERLSTRDSPEAWTFITVPPSLIFAIFSNGIGAKLSNFCLIYGTGKLCIDAKLTHFAAQKKLHKKVCAVTTTCVWTSLIILKVKVAKVEIGDVFILLPWSHSAQFDQQMWQLVSLKT